MEKESLKELLVSIIVPMYNVEKYIEDCVNSITNQSYKNIEVLLINDGSPDKSGLIADRLAQKDNRVKVFHTKNGGVSKSRNFGISKSQGKYLVFVDSDDLLAVDYVDYMLDLFTNTGGDMVMSLNCFKLPSNMNQVAHDEIKKISSDEAATLLMYPGKVNIGCWNKMFKKDFLVSNKILFPESFYMGEGLNFIVEAAQKAHYIGVGNRKVYYYRIDNPTSATTVLNVPKYINALAAIDNIEKRTLSKTKEFSEAISYHRYLTSFAALNAILITGKVAEFKKEYNDYFELTRNEIRHILSTDISFLMKVRICAYSFNPIFASVFFSFLGSVKRLIQK